MYQELLEAVDRLGSINKAAAELGIARSTAQARYKIAMELADEPFTVPPLTSPEEPIEELKARRFRAYKRMKKAHDERKLIRIKMNTMAPVGLAWFGDPHVDNDGCDLGLLYEHADIVRETPGLWGMNVGDNQDLWVGRLMRLYAESSTKASDGWRLAEDFIRTTRDWLALVWGNHDHWQGAGDPLKKIADSYFPVHHGYDVRICLEFPNGREVTFWMRHDFAGHSQWNELHGLVKAAKMGARFNMFVAGHKHTSGHHCEYSDESGIFWHALRTAGYKFIDSHAQALGFRDTNVFQCPVSIIDPEASNPTQLLKIEYDTADGADRLTWLRKRRGF